MRINTANWFFAFVSNDFVNDFLFFQTRVLLANWFSKATFPLRSVPLGPRLLFHLTLFIAHLPLSPEGQ